MTEKDEILKDIFDELEKGGESSFSTASEAMEEATRMFAIVDQRELEKKLDKRTEILKDIKDGKKEDNQRS